jgi:hypothetical protein
MAMPFLRRAIGGIANQRGGALARQPRRAGMDISEVTVSSARTTNFDARTASLGRRPTSARLIRMLRVAFGAALLALSTTGLAQSVRQGVSALNRQDYVSASHIFIPLAEQGVAAAQSYLGFMFETGRGVPQNYTEAAMW